MNYFDPKVLAGVKGLQLKARSLVDGVMVGINESRSRGRSAEFEEHRGYTQGDDPRHIDWKAYAKFDRYFVKEYRETTNLKAFIVMDASGSMGYASDGISKFDYGAILAASLTYLMLKQQEAVGLITFSQGIDRLIAPKSARDHLFTIVKALEDTRPRERTAADAVLQELASSLRGRGLVILISDLLGRPEEIAKGLRQLRSRGSDIIVFHLLDREELLFPFKEPSLFEDMEEDLSLAADPSAIRAAYLKAIGSLIDQYRTVCFSQQIDYALLDTSVGLDQALVRYIKWRQKFRTR